MKLSHQEKVDAYDWMVKNNKKPIDVQSKFGLSQPSLSATKRSIDLLGRDKIEEFLRDGALLIGHVRAFSFEAIVRETKKQNKLEWEKLNEQFRKS